MRGNCCTVDEDAGERHTAPALLLPFTFFKDFIIGSRRHSSAQSELSLARETL